MATLHSIKLNYLVDYNDETKKKSFYYEAKALNFKKIKSEMLKFMKAYSDCQDEVLFVYCLYNAEILDESGIFRFNEEETKKYRDEITDAFQKLSDKIDLQQADKIINKK